MPKEDNHVNNPHDTGYQYLLKSKKAFLQLLRSFTKKGWVDQVDETDLVLIDKTFILQDFQNKEADIVYKAKIKDREVIFYVLLELQSTVDYSMPYRLLLYMTEIWREIFKNTEKNEAVSKSFRLPVIVPMVLYNAERKWTAPLNFKESLNNPELFGEHVLDFRYILINVYDYDREELLRLRNLMGAVFLLDRAEDFKEIIECLKELTEVFPKMDEDEFRLFVGWGRNILTRGLASGEKQEISKILESANPKEVDVMVSNVEKVLKKSREEAKKEGMKEGMKEGKKEGMKEIAKLMLADGKEIEEIKKYTSLSREEIEELK